MELQPIPIEHHPITPELNPITLQWWMLLLLVLERLLFSLPDIILVDVFKLGEVVETLLHQVTTILAQCTLHRKLKGGGGQRGLTGP